MDCCLTGSSVHGIFQARILGRLPFPTLGDLPHPGIEPTSCVSYIGRWIIYHWATFEAPSNDHSRYNFMTACSVSETLLGTLYQFSSVAQSCLTLRPHGLQHARLPCPSPTPRPCSNSHPLSWWCHPTISSPLIPSHPLFFLSSIFPSIRVFSKESLLRIRWPKYWSFGFSISSSMNIQDWFPLG